MSREVRNCVAAALATIAVLSAGCSPLSTDEPPPTEYVLTPSTAGEALPRGALPQTVMLATPEVPAGYDGRHIRVRRPGHRLDHIADARWAAPLPALLHDHLAATLRSHLDASTRVLRTETGRARYRLNVRVSAFEPVYSADPRAGPDVRVAVELSLIDQRTGDVRARTTVERRAEGVDNRVDALVATLGHELSRALVAGLRGWAPIGEPT